MGQQNSKSSNKGRILSEKVFYNEAEEDVAFNQENSVFSCEAKEKEKIPSGNVNEEVLSSEVKEKIHSTSSEDKPDVLSSEQKRGPVDLKLKVPSEEVEEYKRSKVENITGGGVHTSENVTCGEDQKSESVISGGVQNPSNSTSTNGRVQNSEIIVYEVASLEEVNEVKATEAIKFELKEPGSSMPGALHNGEGDPMSALPTNLAGSAVSFGFCLFYVVKLSLEEFYSTMGPLANSIYLETINF